MELVFFGHWTQKWERLNFIVQIKIRIKISSQGCDSKKVVRILRDVKKQKHQQQTCDRRLLN